MTKQIALPNMKDILIQSSKAYDIIMIVGVYSVYPIFCIIPLNNNLTKDPDGHVSWLPKNTFEKAYMKLEDNPMLPSGVSIGQKMVDEFIAYTETKTMGTKTTVVRCVLRNGFEIVESTGCVDEKNYSEKIGYEICMERIKNKIWELLGFLLQMAWNGIQ